MADKTKEELIEEIKLLQKRIVELEKCESEIKELDDKVIRRSVELAITNVDLKDETKERKRAELAVKESEKKYKLLYESSRDAIMILEPPNWQFSAGNPATVKMFGANDEKEFTSKTPYELSPEYQPDGKPSMEKALEMINTAMREGSHFFEWTHKRINGEEFPATVLLTKVKLGEKEFLQATVRDITEFKKVEENNKIFSDAIASAFDCFILTDTRGNITYANASVCKTFGYTLEEFLKLNIADLDADPKVAKKIMQEIVAKGKWGGEVTNIKKNKRKFHCILSAFIIKDVRGNPKGTMGILREIAERKKAKKRR